MSENTKKKRVSKKAPKSWRKNINIEDVEDFLEEQRTEERLGTKIAEKSNDELFQIDTSRDEKLLHSAKERRLLKNLKPLKSWGALVNTSKINDPHGDRSKIKTRDDGLKTEIKRLQRQKGIIPKKELHASKQRQESKQKKLENRKARKAKECFKNDLWEIQEEKPVPQELKDPWLELNVVEHTLKNTGKNCIRAPKQIREKRSELPSIELPHPGTSYNPSFQDHQNLLRKVIEKESHIIKKQNHLDRVTTYMFSKVSTTERDADLMKEMEQGLPLDEENGDNIKSEPDSDTPESKSIKFGGVKNKKKSKQQRRKQREQRDIKLKLKALKMEKRKINDLNRLRLINKLIEQNMKKLKRIRRERLEKINLLLKYGTARLGRLRYEEPEVDIQLPENLSGNLRNLKPEGKLLTDRFLNLQKRNMAAPSQHCGIKPRTKVKRFVRNSHKQPPLQKMMGKKQ